MTKSTGRKFLLDANVFIEANRRYYGFDLCPGFWDSLVSHYEAGRIQSISQVKEELERGGDELKTWVTSVMPAGCFASTDDSAVIDAFGQMLSWVQAQSQFFPEAKAEFAAKADGWLIAYAKTSGLALVTHEGFAPDARKKVPMPNLCKAFGVPYVDTFEMLKELGVKFYWKSAK